ncbi:MAG: hypothetical protein QW247_06185 [Pyrobaculum sp.]
MDVDAVFQAVKRGVEKAKSMGIKVSIAVVDASGQVWRCTEWRAPTPRRGAEEGGHGGLLQEAHWRAGR